MISQKLPGPYHERQSATKKSTVTNVTLKRGYINSTELCPTILTKQRRKAVIEGKVQRKSGSIILCADDGTEIMRYNFFEGWPTKWKGFTLDGKGTDVNVEELELAVEKIERG